MEIGQTQTLSYVNQSLHRFSKQNQQKALEILKKTASFDNEPEILSLKEATLFNAVISKIINENSKISETTLLLKAEQKLREELFNNKEFEFLKLCYLVTNGSNSKEKYFALDKLQEIYYQLSPEEQRIAQKTIIAALKDTDPKIRDKSVRILTNLRISSALRHIVRMIQLKERDSEVLSSIQKYMESYGYFGQEGYYQALQDISKLPIYRPSQGIVIKDSEVFFRCHRLLSEYTPEKQEILFNELLFEASRADYNPELSLSELEIAEQALQEAREIIKATYPTKTTQEDHFEEILNTALERITYEIENNERYKFLRNIFSNNSPLDKLKKIQELTNKYPAEQIMPMLLEIFEKNKNQLAFTYGMILIFGDIGDPQAIPFIEQFLEDKYLGEVATKTLKKLRKEP